MTGFEMLCYELHVPVKTDDHGLYTGMTRALANICTDLIMSGASESELPALVKKEFYRIFPYMKK